MGDIMCGLDNVKANNLELLQYNYFNYESN